MKRTDVPLTRWAVALACAMVLTVGPLSGCGRGGGSGEAGDVAGGETSAQTPVVEDASPDDEGQPAGEADDSGLPSEGAEQVDGQQVLTGAAGIVDAGMFTFVVPEYWEGRVDVAIDYEGYGPVAKVYLPGDPDALLATLALAEGDEPEVMGDIATHMVGSSADGQGNHVEVWTTNWPFIASSEEAGDPGVSEEALAQLVDLSTGGYLTLEGVRENGLDDMTDEYRFTSMTLASTVAFG